MADPISWTAIAATVAGGTALAGGVVGAMGATAEGNAKAAAAKQNAEIQLYNAQIAEFNRKVALRNKGQVLAESDADARDLILKGERMLSTIRVSYGANNLAITGSVLDVMKDTATEQAYDVAKTMYKGELKGIAYADQAEQERQKAELARMGATREYSAAAYAKEAGDINSISAFLGGASKAASIGLKAA